MFVDVDDGVDEDNGRFAVAPTGDDKVSFDVAGNMRRERDVCKK